MEAMKLCSPDMMGSADREEGESRGAIVSFFGVVVVGWGSGVSAEQFCAALSSALSGVVQRRRATKVDAGGGSLVGSSERARRSRAGQGRAGRPQVQQVARGAKGSFP